MTPLLILALVAAQSGEECPVFLEREGASFSSLAEEYADCMSRPSLPIAAELDAKRTQCGQESGHRDNDAIAWVDHIAKELPGCETRITFVRKSNAQD